MMKKGKGEMEKGKMEKGGPAKVEMTTMPTMEKIDLIKIFIYESFKTNYNHWTK